MRSQTLEASTSRRPQGTRVGHTNSFRHRITRLERSRSSGSTSGSSDQRDGARERSPHASSPQGSRDGSATTDKTGTPSDRGTTRGFLLRRARRPPVPRALGASWSPPRATSRTRPCHGRGDQPCGRSLIARPHGVRLGVTMRVHRVRIVRAYRPLRSQDGAASLELIQQQQVIVAGQRGVIMRGRRGSRYGPPARRRTRKSSVGRRARHRPHADGHDEALLALVRLLTRQAAREVFDQAVAESNRSVEEGRE